MSLQTKYLCSGNSPPVPTHSRAVVVTNLRIVSGVYGWPLGRHGVLPFNPGVTTNWR